MGIFSDRLGVWAAAVVIVLIVIYGASLTLAAGIDIYRERWKSWVQFGMVSLGLIAILSAINRIIGQSFTSGLF